MHAVTLINVVISRWHFKNVEVSRSISPSLKSENKNPDTEWCRWNDDLIESTKDGTFPSLFDEGSEYKGPTESQPLVYHVHGSIDNPGSMVLTERDYFTFVINMNKICT